MRRVVPDETEGTAAITEHLIDHAALFPPASMSMEDALAEDHRVRSGPEGWLVHRFGWPSVFYVMGAVGMLAALLPHQCPDADRAGE